MSATKNSKYYVTYLALADAHKISAARKVDAFGIFTAFHVWGVPATRECSLLLTVICPSDKKHALSVWHKEPNRQPKKVVSFKFKPSSLELPTILLGQRITLQLTRPGLHAVGISNGVTRQPKTPSWLFINVHKQQWPARPTGSELTKLLDDPSAIKAARAVINCQKCGSHFTFEVHLDPSHALSRGARNFPERGSFKCPKCRTVHHLLDIQGQLLNQLGKSATFAEQR